MTDGVAGEYQWQTYDEIYARMRNVGSALISRGFSPEENIGLFSINRAEWVISEYGCFWAGLVTVPLYDTLGDEAIEYIIKKCSIPLVFATCDKAIILAKLADKISTVKTIVVLDKISKELSEISAGSGIKFVELSKLESEGAKDPQKLIPVKTDTIATISFTSGTTGNPKGVLLSHGNLLSFLTGVLHMKEHNQIYPLGGTDIHISYLPLAHVLERCAQVAFMYFGCQIGFYQGDTLKLMDDCAVLKPTLFISVPRLYNKIYDKILGGVKVFGVIEDRLLEA